MIIFSAERLLHIDLDNAIWNVEEPPSMKRCEVAKKM